MTTQLQLPSPPKHYDVQDQAQMRRLISQAISVLQTFTNVSTTNVTNVTVAGNLTSVKTYGAVGDGLTDDTVAIQAAIDSGLAIYFPPGVYITSAALKVTTYNNCGQIIYGSGSYYTPGSVGFSTTPPPNTSVIRPSATVTKAFLVDGTPIGGLATTWVQGFGIENICIDMVNMADDASISGINQIQAWDGHYTNVRVINDGVNKRGWLYQAGAFTTSMTNTQCHVIEMQGSSPSYGVTTITIVNHDGGRLVASNTVNVRVIGGAFQGTAETKFFFRNNCAGIFLATDVEGTGTFLDVDTSLNQLHTACQLQGFSGTYLSGTPGNSAMLLDEQTNFNVYPFNFTWGSINLNNQASGLYYNRSTFLSGDAAQQYYLFLGRSSGDSLWGVAGAANDFLGGTVSGDTVIGSNSAGQATYLMAAGVKAAKATSTGFSTFGTGTLNQGTVNCTTINVTGVATITGTLQSVAYYSQPAADGQMMTLTNAAGSAYLIASSNVTAANSHLDLGNGAKLEGFSDNFVTRTVLLDSATGALSMSGYVALGGSQTITARQTGWTPPTGTLSRATFDQSTVTLAQLAQTVAALITDLTTHGLIGA